MARVGAGRQQFRLTVSDQTAEALDRIAEGSRLTRSEVAEAALDALVGKRMTVSVSAPLPPRKARQEALRGMLR